jgi:hypothetical protein
MVKHTSLLQKSVNYGRKKCYDTDPWMRFGIIYNSGKMTLNKLEIIPFSKHSSFLLNSIIYLKYPNMTNYL